MLRSYIKSLISWSFVSDLNCQYFAYTGMILAADPGALGGMCYVQSGCP